MIELFLVRSNEMIEIPVESVAWSGQRYKAARKIEARVFYRAIREGDTLLFKWKGREVFRGTVFRRQRRKDSMLSIVAYDMLQYLLRNKDVYVFSNRRADQILTRICNDFGIPRGRIVNTEYVIKSLPFVNETTLYDMVLKGLIETDKQSRKRFRLFSDKGKVNLEPVVTPSGMWVLETGVNVEDYLISTSIEETATQVKLVSGEENNPKTVVVTDAEGRRRFGTLQYFEKVSEDLNRAQLTQRANNLLSKHGGLKSELDIEAIGIRDVISGIPVLVHLENVTIKKNYYVDTDTHVFIGNSHTMNLHLVEENDLPEVNV